MSLTTVVYLPCLPSLTEDRAYLVSYQRVRLDSVTIPEYFAPPRVFLRWPLRGE
jgi:hypothetical protein